MQGGSRERVPVNIKLFYILAKMGKITLVMFN